MHKMHVVIGGYGRVGRQLSRMLEFEGHSISVIDSNPLSFEDADEDILGEKVVGQVFDKGALEAAGIERADVYAAVTSGDNSNIVSARIAREEYRVPRVLARIYDPRRAEIYRNLGIPTIASVAWTSSRLLDMISHPDLHSVFQFGNDEVELIEATAPAGLVGRTLNDFEVPGEVRVASVMRGAAAILPTAGFVFETGDILYVNVARESVPTLERLLGLKE